MATMTQEIQKKEAEEKRGLERTRSKRVYTPAVDILEEKDGLLLIADMPGVDENSVDITLEKNVLSIHGKVEPEVPENHRLSASEYGIGDYQRSFNLSDELDREKIQARVKNGVLRLTLPKAEIAKTRKIPVKPD